ncbi:hypothetical protein RRG08_058283 [Elysia crispata]|uniref:gamma-glutamylcyclotransferase n=1 Tax=Elysia crispata TaxID=231223 RepID=A0AAE0YVA1_9GAST|nr:hypothetical protein RRG08_058283 [Elysia crispata]
MQIFTIIQSTIIRNAKKILIAMSALHLAADQKFADFEKPCGSIFSINQSASSGNMAHQAVKDTFKYFAYGSNLLRERILINNPSAKFYGIGKLNGYTIAFDSPEGVSTDRWFGGGATIHKVNSPSHVYGVIWDIHNSDLESLDRQESVYNALQVDVEVISQSQPEITEQTSAEVVQCRTYQMFKGKGNTLPSPYYKKVILMGARQNGLPEDYIRFVERLPDNQVTEEPVAYKKVMEMLKQMHGTETQEYDQ